MDYSNIVELKSLEQNNKLYVRVLEFIGSKGWKPDFVEYTDLSSF